MFITDSYAIALASLLEEVEYPVSLPLGNNYGVRIENHLCGDWMPHYTWQVYEKRGDGIHYIVATKSTQPMFCMNWTVVCEMMQWSVAEMNSHREEQHRADKRKEG